MTDRPPLRCEQVSADLLAGPTDDVQSRRIATHLATCSSCRSLSRTLDRDRARLGRHLDTAEWQPVADRVFAALPGRIRSNRTGPRPTPQPRMLRRLADTPDNASASRSAADNSWRMVSGRSNPLAASLRAACLIVVGLGLGLALQQVWTINSGDPTAEATQLAGGQQGAALGGQPGTTDGTGTDASSAYIPAPGDNPPLVGPGPAGGITASQNRDTWRSVRRTVQDGISPLLYQPVPPGTFDSVVIETMATDAFAVRYAAEDMAIVMSAGPAAGNSTVTGENTYEAVVRGTSATVTIAQTTTPGRGGLRLDGQPSTALAAGTIVEVTWTEAGLLQDAATASSSSALPYRVTAAGLPVDVVMTFVESLVPFGSGWDELRDDLPTGSTIVTPGAMPNGFGAASLIDRTVTGNATGDGTAVTYTIAYRRTTSAVVERIVFSATPAGDDAESGSGSGSGSLTVLGHTATEAATAPTASEPATRSISWISGATRYRIDFLGNGFTDTDIGTVLDGLSETILPEVGAMSSQSAAIPLDRAA